MANHYTSAVVSPEIPTAALTKETIEILEGFGFLLETNAGLTYLSAHEYTAASFTDEGEEYDEEDLIKIFQGIIKVSNFNYITLEFSYSCDKMRQDGFGGSAWFITGTDVDYISTQQWLSEKIKYLEPQVHLPEPIIRCSCKDRWETFGHTHQNSTRSNRNFQLVLSLLKDHQGEDTKCPDCGKYKWVNPLKGNERITEMRKK